MDHAHRLRKNKGALWRHHVVLRCCPSVVKHGNTITRRAHGRRARESYFQTILSARHFAHMAKWLSVSERLLAPAKMPSKCFVVLPSFYSAIRGLLLRVNSLLPCVFHSPATLGIKLPTHPGWLYKSPLTMGKSQLTLSEAPPTPGKSLLALSKSILILGKSPLTLGKSSALWTISVSRRRMMSLSSRNGGSNTSLAPSILSWTTMIYDNTINTLPRATQEPCASITREKFLQQNGHQLNRA